MLNKEQRVRNRGTTTLWCNKKVPEIGAGYVNDKQRAKEQQCQARSGGVAMLNKGIGAITSNKDKGATKSSKDKGTRC